MHYSADVLGGTCRRCNRLHFGTRSAVESTRFFLPQSHTGRSLNAPVIIDQVATLRIT